MFSLVGMIMDSGRRGVGKDWSQVRSPQQKEAILPQTTQQQSAEVATQKPVGLL